MDRDPTADFAPPRAERSAYARIYGKASRFLARNVVSKRLAMRNPLPVVTFTFDDAAASACDLGARLLAQFGARGTYFISGAGCGAMSPGGRLATAEQVKALAADGHEIGCHTFLHTAVSEVDRQALLVEVTRNRAFLQGLGRDVQVRNFAYPYGDVSFAAKRCLETHFDSCRSLRPGVNAGTADLGALKVCELQDASIGRQGVLEIVTEAARRNGWLIFVCHDVEDRPSRYGVSPQLLEFALTTACAAGCLLTTVAEALELLRGAAPQRSGEARAQARIN